MNATDQEKPDKQDKTEKHPKTGYPENPYDPNAPDSPGKHRKSSSDDASEAEVLGLGTYKYSSLIHGEQTDAENTDENEEHEKTEDPEEESEGSVEHRHAQKGTATAAKPKSAKKSPRKSVLSRKAAPVRAGTRRYSY